jgi:spore coat protein SA
MLKLFFQTTGVLVHYNYALPYYLIRTGRVKEVHLLTSIFSILMGGSHYIKSEKNIKFRISKFGVNFVDTPKIMKLFEKILVKHMTLGHYDVIHLNSCDETIKGLLDILVPKIFVLHGSPDYMNKERVHLLERLHSKVNCFVAPSMFAARKLYEVCGIKPEYVIHHGVDLEIFNPRSYSKDTAKRILRIPSYNKTVLWNARMSPEKKLETLVHALPLIVKDFKDVLVLIKTRAVNKNYEAKILRLVDKLKLRKYIFFDRSWTPLIQMPVYYRAADVFINTSITEAFGSLTMLEAMACGLPTIANNSSSNPEALGDGGLLYNTNDPNDLAEKLLKVLVDDNLAKILSYKAQERIKRGLTLQRQAEEYVKLYYSLK